MDKRLIKIIISMIAGTFVLLGVVVAFKVSANRYRREIQERIYKADELTDTGRIKEATLVLTELLHEEIPSELQEQLDDRLAGLIVSIETAVNAGRVENAAFVLNKLKNERLDPELQQQVGMWRRNLNDELKRITGEKRQTDELARAQAEQERRLARQRQREAEERKRLARDETLAQVGGAFAGMLYAFGLFVVACILIGLGQIIVAFRDVAINSYLVAKTTTDATARTLVAPGQIAPRYRFIPFVVAIFYVAAAIEIMVAVGIVIFIVLALFT